MEPCFLFDQAFVCVVNLFRQWACVVFGTDAVGDLWEEDCRGDVPDHVDACVLVADVRHRPDCLVDLFDYLKLG